MSLSGQASPLADVEQLRADLQRLRELSGELDVSDERINTALTLRTLIELRDLDVGGGRRAGAPRPVGVAAPGDPGTLKAIEVLVQTEADEHILSNDFSIDARVAVLRTTFALESAATASTLTADLTKGNTNALVDFNSGNALTPGAVYAFDLPVTSGLDVNYQIDNQETAAILVAQEIDVAGP